MLEISDLTELIVKKKKINEIKTQLLIAEKSNENCRKK